MDVTEPIIKAALITLGQAYPRSVTFEALFRAASELAQTRGGQQDTLLNALLALAVNGLLDLHAEPVAFAGAREARPRPFQSRAIRLRPAADRDELPSRTGYAQCFSGCAAGNCWTGNAIWRRLPMR